LKNIFTLIFIIVSFNYYSQSKEALIQHYEGLLKLKNNNFEAAIKDFNNVLELNPSDSILIQTFFYRGHCKGMLDDNTGAIIDYTKALQLNPNEDIKDYCYKKRGACKMLLDDYRGAVLDYSKILEKNKNDCIANYSRGLCYGVLGNHSDAIIDLNQAVRFCDDKKSEAYYYLGMSWIALGDINGGCINFSKAGELGSEKAYKSISEYCK
jgi:tetratricopeptide (TPR) repeat protein